MLAGKQNSTVQKLIQDSNNAPRNVPSSDTRPVSVASSPDRLTHRDNAHAPAARLSATAASLNGNLRGEEGGGDEGSTDVVTSRMFVETMYGRAGGANSRVLRAAHGRGRHELTTKVDSLVRQIDRGRRDAPGGASERETGVTKAMAVVGRDVD